MSATGTSPQIAAPAADREALHARYEAIFESITAPFAFVDLDALDANARFMLAQAAGKPIRIASKSVRSVAVLRRILELDPGFEGILSFTLPEALFLARQGFEDIVVAYPTADREALARAGELAPRSRQRAGADGRQLASPRPDRGRRSGAARPSSASAWTSTSAGGRWAEGWRGSAPSARLSEPRSRPAGRRPRSRRAPARAWWG